MRRIDPHGPEASDVPDCFFGVSVFGNSYGGGDDGSGDDASNFQASQTPVHRAQGLNIP